MPDPKLIAGMPLTASGAEHLQRSAAELAYLAGLPGRPEDGPPLVAAKLTSVGTGSDAGHYAWTEQAWNTDGTRRNKLGGLTGTTTRDYAVYPGGGGPASVPTEGVQVFIRRALITETAGWRWEVIASNMAGNIIDVLRIVSPVPAHHNLYYAYVQSFNSTSTVLSDTGSQVVARDLFVHPSTTDILTLPTNKYVLGRKQAEQFNGSDFYDVERYLYPGPATASNFTPSLTPITVASGFVTAGGVDWAGATGDLDGGIGTYLVYATMVGQVMSSTTLNAEVMLTGRLTAAGGVTLTTNPSAPVAYARTVTAGVSVKNCGSLGVCGTAVVSNPATAAVYMTYQLLGNPHTSGNYYGGSIFEGAGSPNTTDGISRVRIG